MRNYFIQVNDDLSVEAEADYVVIGEEGSLSLYEETVLPITGARMLGTPVLVGEFGSFVHFYVKPKVNGEVYNG